MPRWQDTQDTYAGICGRNRLESLSRSLRVGTGSACPRSAAGRFATGFRVTIAPGGGCYRLVALSQWPKSG